MQAILLALADNQLSGTVPYMPKIEVLRLQSNRFTEAKFDAMPASLQLLYLSNNSLSGSVLQLGNSTLGSLNLKLLDLSQNNLTGSLPQDMPPSLSILDVSNNALAGTLPSSWSRLQNMADLRLDNNQLTGTLPPTWSAWGSLTANSIQLSILNTRLHGSMPKQWVQQFCLAIVKSSDSRVLFKPSVVSLFSDSFTFGPLIQLPAQHASINASLGNKTYTFDYDNPDSVCGIPDAARNTGLLWGIFVGLLLATLTCICLWQRCKPRPHGGLLSRISTVLIHDKLHWGRQMVRRVWFLVSDVGWFIYSQVAAAITIHQVFSSGRLDYAYSLLAILLIPFAIMFILVANISIKRCQENIGGGTLMRRAAAPLVGLVLAPMLLFGIEVLLIFHGIGVPLPAWWGFMGVDLLTFYRMESIAEGLFNALPQAVVQSNLYLMGNDPNGVLVYINTNLFVFSMLGSLFAIFKTVVLIAIELHQYSSYCSVLGYCIRLLKFETFPILP